MLTPLQLFLAKQVRRYIEIWCQDNSEVHYPSLEGGCGIASYTLWKVYQAFQIEVDLVGNSGHCFLKLGNFIVDLTATQFFTAPEVYVVEIESKPSYYHRIKHINEEMLDQLETWPIDQQPFQHDVKIDRLIAELKYCRRPE